MGFTSLEFGVFTVLVFVLYWFVVQRSIKQQNLLILVASYVFYGWWDWRFLSLIFISSSVDFLVGLGLQKYDKPSIRNSLLAVSLTVNLGLLGFFKYYNFFVESFKQALAPLADLTSLTTLDIILPVGISFYTLQTLSYTIDVYRRKIPATDQVIDFFAYVSFFPQLVAGPIEKAGKLLPQFHVKRIFSYDQATDGLRQIAWGLFKKMVIADNCAIYVEPVLMNYEQYSASTVFLATCLGTFQLYCDFSGYSDIAIGTARLYGFQLSKNFDYPFFARNISEFWRKWHITLIDWINDYLIGSLGGRSKLKLARNIFLVFFVSGLWHGANWTFIVWGLLQAVMFIPLLFGKRKKYRHPVGHNRRWPSGKEWLAMTKVFLFFGFSGIFFLSPSVQHTLGVYQQCLQLSLFSLPMLPEFELVFIVVLLLVEWRQRNRDHGLDFSGRSIPTGWRWSIYLGLILVILFFGGKPSEFIYFQF